MILRIVGFVVKVLMAIGITCAVLCGQTWHNQVSHKVGHVLIGWGVSYTFKAVGYPKTGLALGWALAVGKEWHDERAGESWKSRAFDVTITGGASTLGFITPTPTMTTRPHLTLALPEGKLVPASEDRALLGSNLSAAAASPASGGAPSLVRGSFAFRVPDPIVGPPQP